MFYSLVIVYRLHLYVLFISNSVQATPVCDNVINSSNLIRRLERSR